MVLAWVYKMVCKDTPVLMASSANQFSLRNSTKALALAAAMPIVAVPIQEVQLLDYAVAHETVASASLSTGTSASLSSSNATYGLTASTDDDIYLGLMDSQSDKRRSVTERIGSATERIGSATERSRSQDPYTSDQQRERDEYQLDDENWNEVVFEEVYGGSTAKLALHNDWIEKQSYEIDAVVNLDLPEQGISGPFRIISIKHIIPQKKPVDDDEADEYDYRPVTALFTHESNQVFNISFDNGEELGVTYQHPIYSTTAGDWKLAGELEIGEEVLTKSGNTKVVSSTKKDGSETVYNLEVKELHNFLVGKRGIVVHNACIPPVKPLLQNMSQVFNNWLNAFPTVVRQATTDYYQYQKRILGTLTERRIPLKKPHNFTKDNLDVDGFEPSTGSVIDTKFVRNPSNSPYTGGSSFPPIQDELLDELKRYKHIIDDVDTPVRDLKIVTNHPDAKTYLEGLMNSLNIPGGVVVIK